MKRYRVLPFVLPSLLLVGLIVGALLASWGNSGLAGVVPDPARRLLRLRAWLADPAAQAGWRVEAGQRCRPDAPMVMPTSGYIGFGYGDSFRPGHRHSGYDIFTPDDAVDVTPAIEVSQATIRNIEQNLVGAFIYNVLGIPVAMGLLYPFFGILLSPLIAGAAMAFSSVTVVSNANRLRAFKPRMSAR